MTLMKIKFNGKEIRGSNLKAIRKGNINKLIIGQLNINSLRNKFDPPGFRNETR